MNPSCDADRRFGGVNRLYGAGTLERLAAAHVCVIGIGGVGSWAAEALARSGVGRLTLIDLDHVAESNVNRQLHALTATLGQAKVAAMAERIAGINPGCVVRTVDDFVTPENVAALLPACDGVVDAIDQVRAKAALIAHCRRLGIPVVTTGGAGGRTDPSRLKVDDLSRTTQDALAAKVRARLRKEYGFPRDPKKKFGVDCVYSDEPIQRPQALACDVEPGAPHGASDAALHGLNCAGYGSSVCVTAPFGFAAAARILGRLTTGREAQ
ncbi:ThiF family adenylyltransferase [Denitratisoma sp. DHT3]|uniref:tRNA threonylcarbamoyladenosine dehydratase n=1 Tax=Denitratisoma sp. DHT3 TaxID=1981880 RepID=UPI001C98B54D|nr:tRNA threonylcarbamoyladenosine dehydratase [Denitratisoma sp. DHT3]